MPNLILLSTEKGEKMAGYFAQIPQRAFELAPHLYKLLAYICYRSTGEKAVAWVSVGKMAEKMGCGTRNIQKSINELIDKGYLIKSHRYVSDQKDINGKNIIKTVPEGEKVKGKQLENYLKVVWDDDPRGKNLVDEDFEEAEKIGRDIDARDAKNKTKKVIHKNCHRDELPVHGGGELPVHGGGELPVHPQETHNTLTNNISKEEHISLSDFKKNEWWEGERDIGAEGSLMESRYWRDIKAFVVNEIELGSTNIKDIMQEWRGDIDEIFEEWKKWWSNPKRRQKIKAPVRAFEGFLRSYIKKRTA